MADVDVGVVNAVLSVEGLSSDDSVHCTWGTQDPPGDAYWRYADPADINWKDREDNTTRKYILRGLVESTKYYWQLYVNDALADSGSFTTLPRYQSSITDEFLDTFLIASKDSGLSIHQSEGRKSDANPLIPASLCNAGYWSAMHKDGHYKAWGHNQGRQLEYFTSQDGLSFTHQSTALTTSYHLMWGGGLIFDDRDDLYKMIYMSQGDHEIETLARGKEPGELQNVEDIIHSIHDERNRGDDEVMTLFVDTLGANSLASYTNMHDPPDHGFIGHCVGFSDTDWMIFTDRHEHLGLSGGVAGEETYGMTATIRNGLYLALVRSFDDSSNPGGGDETIDCYLAVSRNGVNWYYIDSSTPIIPLGPDGSWDDGMIFSVTPPVLTHGDIDYCYYGGCDGLHDGRGGDKSQLGLITFRKDGLTHLSGTGHFTTKTFDFTPDKLTVNAACSEQANMRIAVLDSDGKEVAGYGMATCDPIVRDGTDITPTWNGKSIGDLPHDRFRLRFRFQGAPRLYAYTVSGSAN